MLKSTQKELIRIIKEEPKEIAIYTNNQTDGIGSRGNKWIGKKGNFFLSFSINKYKLENIPLQSLSIYIAYIFKETLSELGSRVLLKWPNDFYLDKKIGGVITNIVKNYIVCGIGLNSRYSLDGFEKLDIDIDENIILNNFFEKLERFSSWETVFNKFKIEFYNNNFKTSDNLFFKDFILNEDGSIEINNERKYSLR